MVKLADYIKELQKYDPEMEVKIWASDGNLYEPEQARVIGFSPSEYAEEEEEEDGAERDETDGMGLDRDDNGTHYLILNPEY